MDTLRASLEILFKEMRAEPFLSENVKFGDQHFDQDRFIRMVQRKFNGLTIDQCNISSQIVRQYYMLPPDNTILPDRKSVFNVLLHFNREVLREYKGEPVCKFEHLLRWNSISALLGEDLLTTSYLAYEDLQSIQPRKRFDWKLVIDQDDPNLCDLFTRKMADVHLHLLGSSSNFDLNWLSLMNFPQDRAEEFKQLSVLQHTRQIVHDAESVNLSLYALTLKACAIRYLLYAKYVNKHSLSKEATKLIYRTISANDYSTRLQSQALDSMIRGDAMQTNRRSKLLNHDYAWQVDVSAVKANPNCILSGERSLLYCCFRACYAGTISNRDSNLLYAYLLIKNHIRNELVQTNEVVGFGNFDTYEKRKNLFIKRHSIYERLIEPLALGQYFYDGRDRYVEPRITPREEAWRIRQYIETLDSTLKNLSQANPEDYHYVLHFIKTKDQKLSKSALQHPRHHKLRDKLCRQAIAIASFWKHPALSSRVVGIDAANSEIFTRPEVFAQVFRFLRNEQILKSDKQVASPGMTYHVGEDFLSMIDGLRAIDEVLHYLQFRRGDRLGHALVLGVDSAYYLEMHHHTLLLPKMVVLDDIAWSLHKTEDNNLLAAIRNPLETIFYQVFREVYGCNYSITIRDYYESWLLRGDNPTRYEQFHSRGIKYTNQISNWSKFDFNHDAEACSARTNQRAGQLYYDYHFNRSVRKKGEAIMELRCPEKTDLLITHLQQQILQQLESMNIGIETNPTSNMRIGGFRRYLDHPVMKFHSTDNNRFCLSASINTDDKGVFATSIEREYALLACAIFKETLHTSTSQGHMRMPDICNWLDRIRQSGLTQRFHKP